MLNLFKKKVNHKISRILLYKNDSSSKLIMLTKVENKDIKKYFKTTIDKDNFKVTYFKALNAIQSYNNEDGDSDFTNFVGLENIEDLVKYYSSIWVIYLHEKNQIMIAPVLKHKSLSTYELKTTDPVKDIFLDINASIDEIYNNVIKLFNEITQIEKDRGNIKENIN